MFNQQREHSCHLHPIAFGRQEGFHRVPQVLIFEHAVAASVYISKRFVAIRSDSQSHALLRLGLEQAVDRYCDGTRKYDVC